MPKVHPNTSSSSLATKTQPPDVPMSGAEVLTVWNKSLLFNGKGFTVFDSKGNLVFRVDSYASVTKSSDIVLMDATGSPLLTIRRKQRLGLGDTWGVYEGEETRTTRFVVKKHVSFMNAKSLAHVACSSGADAAYEIEGSYARRCCAVYDGERRCVAEIKRKEAAVGGVSLGVDVFRLVVQPEIECSVAMALVVLLEQMFGSR
ncbi:hypothetical protein Syun_017015 [Stephania yunnanensis]|uniref:Protein LURP-one-related 8 n=1 Tax=Stephania yunnanensis TaxID=152371 RepID=A0AAP0J688_9MAGN